MDASKLAAKMLEWERVKHALDTLTKEIQAAVLEIGTTQTVGNVRARYSKGRGRYDYERAWLEHGMEYPDVDIEDFKKVSYDYTKACKKTGMPMDEYYEQKSGPSVSVKLL